MSTIDRMVAAAASRAGELAAPRLDAHPRLKAAILTCMDARIDVFRMLGADQGDIHVVRNAGGLATDDAIRSLSISQRLLGTQEIMVIMHEGCGLEGASDEAFNAALAADGAIATWRLQAFDDLDAALRANLERLRSSRELPARNRIRGFVFDPASGALREVA